MRRSYSPTPMGPRRDFAMEARLREVEERERLIELEQQIIIKEQQAKEQQAMLLNREMDKRRFEMMEMENRSYHPGPSGPPPGGHHRPRSPSPPPAPAPRRRNEPPASYRGGPSPDNFEEPLPKRRAPSMPRVEMGNNEDASIYRNMTDCCIIYVDKQLRGYAESVQNLLVAAGLKSEMQFISRDESLPNTLDNLSAKGIVSAIILDELSEQRKSANVHFLHGCPRGEVQTSVTELPHWLKMQEEYNKYLVKANKRTQSLRELLAELCGEQRGRSRSPRGAFNGPSGGGNGDHRSGAAREFNSMMDSNQPSRSFAR